jgi:hypothetical protein
MNYSILQSEANTAISNGYAMAGITAYVYPTQLCGSTPIYHVFNPSTSDDFYTSEFFSLGSSESDLWLTSQRLPVPEDLGPELGLHYRQRDCFLYPIGWLLGVLVAVTI